MDAGILINDHLDNSQLVSASLIKFDCFKSYEETTAYLKGENVIRFVFLYHYATLIYDPSFRVPTPAKDGNYYNVQNPVIASCGDVWLTTTDVLINDYRLKTRVEAILEQVNSLLVDDYLARLGFAPCNTSMIYRKGLQITKS
jgi:hypothetical protein